MAPWSTLLILSPILSSVNKMGGEGGGLLSAGIPATVGKEGIEGLPPGDNLPVVGGSGPGVEGSPREGTGPSSLKGKLRHE